MRMEQIRHPSAARFSGFARLSSWIRPRWVRIAAVAILAIGLAQFFLGSGDHPAYEEAVASRGPVERTVSASGTLQPLVSVKVGSQVSGLVTFVYADINDEVVKGQLLAAIDPANANAAVRQAQAAIAAANAAGSQANASEAGATADLTLRRLELQRQQSLLARGFTTKRAVDEATAAYSRARANLDAARAQRRASIADREKGEAVLSDASTNLGRTQIRSPISGLVIERNIEPGQTLASVFQTPVLFEIAASLDRMQIETKVDEADIGEVREGQPARFTVDAFPEETFPGVVRRVRKQAENSNGIVTYAVIIDVPNRGRMLLPGMTANVTIVTGRRERVLRVSVGAYTFTPQQKKPSSGLRITVTTSEEAERQRRIDSAMQQPRRRNGTVLWRVTGSSTTPLEPITTKVGLRGDDFVEVIGGDVKVGDRFASGMKDSDER